MGLPGLNQGMWGRSLPGAPENTLSQPLPASQAPAPAPHPDTPAVLTAHP